MRRGPGTIQIIMKLMLLFTAKTSHRAHPFILPPLCSSPFSNSRGLYLLSNPLPTAPTHTHTFFFLILSPMKL